MRRAQRNGPTSPEDPPPGLYVLPGDPDGWTIALQIRSKRSVNARLLIGFVLGVLTAGMLAIEPALALLPGFGLLALGAMVLVEATGPGRDIARFIHIGTPGLRVDGTANQPEQSIPAAELRDVFWRETVPGEVALHVRGPAGEREVVRVPTDPPFFNGLDAEQREWIAETIRTVGRRNQRRAGTEADVPKALSAMKQQPDGGKSR